MATLMMMSHHAFRRDIGRLAGALEQIAKGDGSRVGAVREEWQNYRAALTGHHTVEDTAIFPDLRSKHTELAATLDELEAHHRRMHSLLEAGDRAFESLSDARPAASVVSELSALLDQHLAMEEASAIPHLREAKEFPTPASEAEAEMYAQGFAWSMCGIADEVIERVHEMLPESLKSKLPAALKAFDARCQRAWGTVKTGASRSSVPNW
jgi:Hemerythrin HHE cation binding domain